MSLIRHVDGSAIGFHQIFPVCGVSFAQHVPGEPRKEFAAIWTGEKRRPKAGEWYLSGAIVEAYKAHSDMTSAYHIAKIVQVRRNPATYSIVSGG